MTAASRTLVQTLAQLTPEQVELRDDFIRCCRDTRQTMPARWLYDHRGSELFEEITTLTEYYPTRTELALLRDADAKLHEAIGEGRMLIEFGAGSAHKTPALIEAIRPAR